MSKLTQEEIEKKFHELTEKMMNHNNQLGKMDVEGCTHFEVIEVPRDGIVLCKMNTGHLTLMMGEFGRKVGDIISLIPTGETAGDAIGMKIVNKTTMN